MNIEFIMLPTLSKITHKITKFFFIKNIKPQKPNLKTYH